MNPSLIPKEDVYIVKKSGERLGPIKATISAKSAQLYTDSLQIHEYDVLERSLPSGAVERYEIYGDTFYAKGQLIPAHVDLEIRRI